MRHNVAQHAGGVDSQSKMSRRAAHLIAAMSTRSTLEAPQAKNLPAAIESRSKNIRGRALLLTRVKADRALLSAEPAAATRTGRGESRLASGARRSWNRDHRVRERVAARARRALRAPCAGHLAPAPTFPTASFDAVSKHMDERVASGGDDGVSAAACGGRHRRFVLVLTMLENALPTPPRDSSQSQPVVICHALARPLASTAP
jgi:hypothetical protein